MTKRDKDAKIISGTAAGKKRPYKTPQLAIYGKLAELTAGETGSQPDPGHTAPTRR